MIAVVAGMLGLAVGSFLNVVAYRLPRGESLSRPRSRCPGCATPVRPLDNVPVLSWLALRGRCRTCRMPISPRYPLIEALTAALCVAVVLAGGGEPETLLGLAFVLLLVPIAFIDLDHRIIPNKLTGLGAVTALALVAALRPADLPEHLAAGAGAGRVPARGRASPARAGWAWATSSWPASWASSWAWPWCPPSSPRSSPARSSASP